MISGAGILDLSWSSRETVEVMKIDEYSWDIYMSFYIRLKRHIIDLAQGWVDSAEVNRLIFSSPHPLTRRHGNDKSGDTEMSGIDNIKIESKS